MESAARHLARERAGCRQHTLPKRPFMRAAQAEFTHPKDALGGQGTRRVTADGLRDGREFECAVNRPNGVIVNWVVARRRRGRLRLSLGLPQHGLLLIQIEVEREGRVIFTKPSSAVEAASGTALAAPVAPWRGGAVAKPEMAACYGRRS